MMREYHDTATRTTSQTDPIRTADWLCKVEHNRISLDRLSVIRRLASALDVFLGDLIGEPALMEWTEDQGSGPCWRCGWR